MSARVLIAAVIGPSGIRGAVKLKTFTADPMDVNAYGPLETEAGDKRFKIDVMRGAKDAIVVASIEGIKDRDAAEALKGLQLFAPRSALPETEDDEFYLADLIGLDAVDPSGNPLGKVTAVQNFGAGDLIEVSGQFFAFTREVVPVIDVANGRLVIDTPAEIDP